MLDVAFTKYVIETVFNISTRKNNLISRYLN